MIIGWPYRKRAPRRSRKLIRIYKENTQKHLKELHFFGIQAFEDFIEGKISDIQFQDVLESVEEGLNRYLLLIRELKKRG